MTSNPLAKGLSGAIFGAALTAAGVISPSVIIAQMKLQNFQMLNVFLIATASGAIILRVLNQTGFITTKGRAPQNLGWFGPYDGNIIGGLMIGFGMALTGSCPGTVYAQVGAGLTSGRLVLLGGVIGGILYTGVSNRLQTKRAKEAHVDSRLTISEKTNIDANIVLIAFEGLCALVVALASTYGSPRSGQLLSPIIGGLLMGGSQLASVLLTKTTLGISGSYEEIGQWFWRFTGRFRESPSTASIIFAIGTTLGSWIITTSRPDMIISDNVLLSPLRLILGGVVMAFGSRLAGGCTSGHGISGIASFGVSSIISTISMFVGGVVLIQFVN